MNFENFKKYKFIKEWREESFGNYTLYLPKGEEIQ